MDGGGDGDYFKQDGDFRDAGDSNAEPEQTNRGYRDLVSMDEVRKDHADHPEKVADLRKRYLGDKSDKKDFLKNGEKAASKDPNGGGRGGDKDASLREKEDNVGSENDDSSVGKIKNSVKGVQDIKSGKVGKGVGRIMKSGPLGIIVAGLLLFSGASFFGQSAMGFNLIAVLQGEYGDMGSSLFAREKYFMRWQLRPSSRKTSTEADDFVAKHSKIYQKFTGKDENYFKLTSKQKKKLNKAHISVVRDDVAANDYVLKFTRGDGSEIIAVADSNQVGDNRYLLKDLLDTDPEFKAAYDTGTATWKNPVAQWFDKKASAFMKRLEMSRNRLKGLFEKNKANSSENVEAFEGVAKNAVGDGDVEGKTGSGSLEETSTTNKDGSVDTSYSSGEDGEASLNLKKGDDVDTTKKKLEDFAGESGVGGKVAKATKALANGACTVAGIIGAINMFVIASEAQQIRDFASMILEGEQKNQVETSGEGSINIINNSLTKKKKTSYLTKDNEKVEMYGSAMEANLVSSAFGKKIPNGNDPSVNSFSLTDSMDTIMTKLGSSMESFKACTFARMGAALLDSALDVAGLTAKGGSIAACVAGGIETLGGACIPFLIELGVTIGKSWAANLLIKEIVTKVTEFMLPKIVTILARDLTTNIGGVDAGNALVGGFAQFSMLNFQSGGGAIASKETYITHLQEKDKYIADLAESERAKRSPFDPTSPYTFLGSLLTKASPLLVGTSSISSGINNFNNLASESIASIMPSASATSAALTADNEEKFTSKYCPYISAIGGIATPGCYPRMITDYKTINMDPAEIVKKVSEFNNGKNFDLTKEDEDTPTINENLEESKLMKYLLLGQRAITTFGLADENVKNAIDSGAGTLESSIPVWGGFTDVLTNSKYLDNLGIISGESLVAKDMSEGSLGKEAFTWEEAKYYQRFIEDQRLAENMGLIEESSVSVALRHYYEKHPIDTSYEGMLAYYSGMTKEHVADVMDIMEGMLWLADYDPSDFYPYKSNNDAITVKEEKSEDNKNIETLSGIMPNTIYLAYRQEYYIS